MAPGPDRATRALFRGFVRRYPDEVARLLDNAQPTEVVRLLTAEPTPDAVTVLERLSAETAARALAEFDEAAARRILPAVDPGRAAGLLARLDEETRERRLTLLAPGQATELRALMTYPPDSAGRMMDPRVLALRPETRVRDALVRLRSLRQQPIDTVFLADGAGRLVGAVQLPEVALAPPAEPLSALSRGVPASVHAMGTREEVVELLDRRRVTSLPVVDIEGRLLGVIRQEGLMAAVQEETTADIQTMVGASRDERALSGTLFAVRKRLPWLQINLATAFLAAAVVGVFENTIARFTALAVLLPVVAGQSGNTGAQALAVTMRGLALREIRLRHWLRVSVKEANAATVNGIAVALTTSLGVYLWSRSPGLALVIGLSMVISMVAAGLSGASIPMILTALGQDPAQSSSIILTTITDVVGFLSFLGIATLLAGLL